MKNVISRLILRDTLVKQVIGILPTSIVKGGLKLLNYNITIPGLNVITPFDIDFQETMVYCPAGYGYVRINARDPKNYEKIVTFLTEKLLYQLIDPETQKNIIEKIYRKEELYHGPYIDQASDLIIVPKKGYFISSSCLDNETVFKYANDMENGTHRSHGFIALFGPEIRKANKLKGSRIEDITPTILYLQGVPIPKDMDGQVLTQAVTKEFLEKHPIIYEEEKTTRLLREKARYKYSKEEEKEIKARLKALGYI